MYNQQNWLEFHRYFLEQFPCNASYFIDECQKYFPNIYFHERNKETIVNTDGNWKNFVKPFIQHLSALSDYFPKYLENREHYQRIEALRSFGSECNVEVTAQGNIKHKPQMTFVFENHETRNENICCEPHLKLNRSSKNSDNTFYQNRIYFHEGKENIQNGKILVGHIGKHIDFEK